MARAKAKTKLTYLDIVILPRNKKKWERLLKQHVRFS